MGRRATADANVVNTHVPRRHRKVRHFKPRAGKGIQGDGETTILALVLENGKGRLLLCRPVGNRERGNMTIDRISNLFYHGQQGIGPPGAIEANDLRTLILDDPAGIGKRIPILTFVVDRAKSDHDGQAELLGDLKNASEPTGTLLDDSMVLYGSNFGDANKHTTDNMPVLLAGGGFRHGQHLAFDRKKNYPLPNLFVSMLQQMGIETDTFASATGTMRGLT